MKSLSLRFRLMIFLTVFTWLAVSSQSVQNGVTFRTLSIEHGLSQSIVIAMTQDSRGFMWFVTEDGLNRYDGYTFKIFKPDPKDPNSLAHNEIKSISESSDGTLWIGSFYKGLEHFDPATEKFAHYQHDPADPASLGNNIVWAVLEDRKGRVWVGTGGGGLDLLDRRRGVSDISGVTLQILHRYRETTSGRFLKTGPAQSGWEPRRRALQARSGNREIHALYS